MEALNIDVVVFIQQLFEGFGTQLFNFTQVALSFEAHVVILLFIFYCIEMQLGLRLVLYLGLSVALNNLLT